MSRRAWPWSLLGIARTADTGAIRKAYAQAIKAMDLDKDVEGYASLREARDVALRQAKAMAARPAGAEEREALEDTEPQDAPPLGMHTTPVLDTPATGEPALTVSALNVASPAPAEAFVAFAPGTALPDRGESTPDKPLAPDRTLGPPVLELHENPGTVGPAALATPFDRLDALIGQDGDHGNAPFDDREEAEALAALAGVIDAAHRADLTRQDQVELWLATLLADAWPRSAPLLEPATEAFGWSHEWGKIDARPVIEYLGARLRGYRFQQKVRAPDHRFHKAWAELVRPGEAGPLRFLRTTSSDVQGLLAGVRKHFPELEDHFDGARVSSWESGSAWPTGAIVVVGLLILAFLLSLGDPRPGPGATGTAAPPTVVVDEPDPGPLRALTARIVAEAFGGDWSPYTLWDRQPELATTLTSNASYALTRKLGEADALRKAIEIVRQRSYLDGRGQDGALFDQTMRARLGLLRAARASDPAACVLYLNGGVLPAGVTVPERLREQERKLARTLAEKGLLVVPKPSPATSARVPGALVDKVVAATSLSEAKVAQGLQGKGTDANRCAVAIALLDATLDWRGEGRRAILLTL